MQPLEDTDPRQLGGWRIVARIGEGGMGTVYLGVRLDDDPPLGLLESMTPPIDPFFEAQIGRLNPPLLTPWKLVRRGPVAIKTISLRYASDPSARERFRREVAACEKSHDWAATGREAAHYRREGFDLRDGTAVLPMFEEGPRFIRPNDATPMPIAHGEEPIPWFAMQYMPDPTLAELPGLGIELDCCDRFSLLHSAAQELRWLHSLGLVHRDIKPSNVAYTDNYETILFDLGIALDSNNVPLTTVGAVIGTVAFMSPEQVEGKPVGPASDLFSLASTVVWTVTRKSPFSGTSRMATMYAICTAEPDLAGVPADLAMILRQCLEKEPEKRPTAAQLAEVTYKSHPFDCPGRKYCTPSIGDIEDARWNEALRLCGLE